MNKIKFGTDGWRAIIADDFTVEKRKTRCLCNRIMAKK